MSIVILIGVGVLASAITAAVTREVMLWIVVQPLKRESRERLEQLRAAQTDVKLVKALRAGDLDAADLAEIGVLDDAANRDLVPRLPAPAPNHGLGLDRRISRIAQVLHEVDESPARDAGPSFVPSFYMRNPDVRHLDPGDKVWINPHHVYHAEDGSPIVWDRASTSIDEDREHKVRLRVYEDGSLELGTRPLIKIGGRIDSGLSYRPIARLVHLDTGEIREGLCLKTGTQTPVLSWTRPF